MLVVRKADNATADEIWLYRDELYYLLRTSWEYLSPEKKMESRVEVNFNYILLTSFWAYITGPAIFSIIVVISLS
jgi:hypothetical protein